MKVSSPSFKALTVTVGFSIWFLIITLSLGIFSLEVFLIFIAITITITQVFSAKLSRGLDIFAIINTKIFLGFLFVTIISFYGLSFKLLKIDLLRIKKHSGTYWLDYETSNRFGNEF